MEKTEEVKDRDSFLDMIPLALVSSAVIVVGIVGFIELIKWMDNNAKHN